MALRRSLQSAVRRAADRLVESPSCRDLSPVMFNVDSHEIYPSQGLDLPKDVVGQAEAVLVAARLYFGLELERQAAKMLERIVAPDTTRSGLDLGRCLSASRKLPAAKD